MTIYMTYEEYKKAEMTGHEYVVYLVQGKTIRLRKAKILLGEIIRNMNPSEDLMKEFKAEAKRIEPLKAWNLVHFETRYRSQLLRDSDCITTIRRLKGISKTLELIMVSKTSIRFCPYPIVIDDLIHSGIGDE